MSCFTGQSGAGGIGQPLLQQSDDRPMPRYHRWDYAGGREQLDVFADGMLWSRSRFAGSDGWALVGCESLSAGRFEADISDCVGGQQTKKIIGTTKDSGGTALGSCIVQGFVTATDAYVGAVTSDPGGYYELPTTNTGQHYLVAYKAGSPDVAGTSVNTIVPT